jgi:hypothetical protein
MFESIYRLRTALNIYCERKIYVLHNWKILFLPFFTDLFVRFYDSSIVDAKRQSLEFS